MTSHQCDPLAPLSISVIEKLASAIFTMGAPTVMEAYSALDSELRFFANPQEVVNLAAGKSTLQNRAVHLAIHYPDTGGQVIVRKIALTKCRGAQFRHSAEGWGLISAYLTVGVPNGVASSISALSENRAQAYEGVREGLGPVRSWNWPDVARHVRRPNKILRKDHSRSDCAFPTGRPMRQIPETRIS